MRYVINRDKLLTRACKGFVGYFRRQAAKYGVRGSRVATVRAALALVDADGGRAAKVADLAGPIEAFVEAHQHTSVVTIPTPSGSDLPHWEVCDRKLPWTISTKEARAILQKVFDAYGERALAAERNEGVDWKAVSHAVRVGYQAVELLTTGAMTFPRPEREHLLAIKQGQVAYTAVQPELEDLLRQVEEASVRSPLPPEIDRAWADAVTAGVYRAAVFI